MADVNEVDQNALDPSESTWELDGKKLTVKPPKMRHLGRIMRFSALFNKVQEGSEVTDEEMDSAEAKLDETLLELIPELDTERVSQLPLSKKMDGLALIGQMVTPADSKALDHMGVKPTQKKTESGK